MEALPIVESLEEVAEFQSLHSVAKSTISILLLLMVGDILLPVSGGWPGWQVGQWPISRTFKGYLNHEASEGLARWVIESRRNKVVLMEKVVMVKVFLVKSLAMNRGDDCIV